jgi:hypothetical protein
LGWRLGCQKDADQSQKEPRFAGSSMGSVHEPDCSMTHRI